MMKMMNELKTEETRNINGGATYQCKHCGYQSTNYWKTYANALSCVTRKYGYSVYKIVSSIIPF